MVSATPPAKPPPPTPLFLAITVPLQFLISGAIRVSVYNKSYANPSSRFSTGEKRLKMG
jgi:hypothetical protein